MYVALRPSITDILGMHFAYFPLATREIVQPRLRPKNHVSNLLADTSRIVDISRRILDDENYPSTAPEGSLCPDSDFEGRGDQFRPRRAQIELGIDLQR